MIEAIRTGLAELADPAKAPDMQAYMKSSMPFYGVHKPARAELARAVFDAHPLDDVAAWERYCDSHELSPLSRREALKNV